MNIFEILIYKKYSRMLSPHFGGAGQTFALGKVYA
jgi:hypothetical protein